MAVFDQYEIEDARVAIGIGTSESEMAELEAKLLDLNDAQADYHRKDILAFQEIQYGTTAVYGGYKGTDFSTDRDRTLIVNRIRQRLNYPRITGTVGQDEVGLSDVLVPAWIPSGDC